MHDRSRWIKCRHWRMSRRLVDDALENSGVDDGEVTGISVSRTEAIRASVMVESLRSRALVVFEPDGTPFLVHPL